MSEKQKQVEQSECEYCKADDEKCGTCTQFYDDKDRCGGYCSEEKCIKYTPAKYCFNCGAKMRGVCDMERYIDADKLTRDLIDNRSFYPAIVKSAIENAPTEDVVPRSEYEKLENQLDSLGNQYRAGAEFLCNQAKQDVAREIIDEVFNLLKNNFANTPIYKIAPCKLKAELKKKYIGE